MIDLPTLMYEGKPALPPKMDDLERLHKMILDNFSLTVLEFGCGYSTFVIADALTINWNRWSSNETKPKVRNSKMFKCYSVDTNREWLRECANKIDNDNVVFWNSPCEPGLHNGQLCHYYTKMPDVVPDFIYLDGPDPKQVEGAVNGLSWQCAERTPMAADILLMEPTLIPGTVILVDGRTNNARFLERNLQREWSIVYDQENDFTQMELVEPSLGEINAVGRDINWAFPRKN